ncbi:MAG: copper chaperone PCu(A)C [Dongiaceae bacterium]
MFRVALALAVMLLAGGPLAAYAEDAIVIEQAFARATPAGARNGAVYMTILNRGATADRLVAASSPAAARAELHQTISEGGVMKMRPVDAIPIDPAGKAVLKPGGLHVMLLDLKAPLKQGETVPVTLVFDKAGPMTINVPIQKPGAMGASSGDMSGMNM